MDAYNTDVRPLLAEVREEMGIDPDPMAAYRRSGWAAEDRRRARRRHPGGLGGVTPAPDPLRPDEA